MNNDRHLSVLQIIGLLLFVFTAGIPGLHLAGFYQGTSWPLPIWLLIAAAGGFVGGALLASSHRIAGAVGGVLAGPMGLLAIYLYAHNRTTLHNIEAILVQGVASLPGLGVYFVLALIGNALFPARSPNVDELDDDEEPRPKRRRYVEEDDDEEPRPKRRRRDEDE